jgi:hypothetical protein
MITNILLTIISIILTFPLAHVLIKKAIILDYKLTKNTHKKLRTIFYIPYLNFSLAFLYLIWVIVKFKRPE